MVVLKYLHSIIILVNNRERVRTCRYATSQHQLTCNRETAEVSANPSPQLPAFTMRGGAFHTKLSRK